MSHPNFDPKSNFTGKAANITVRYFAELNAQPLIAPPVEWWKPWAWERGGASIITRFYIPVHSFKPTKWTGAAKFSGTSAVFFDVEREINDFGVKESAMKIAEMDFGAFNLAPASMAKAAGKLPESKFAEAINAGFTTLDWTGTNFFRTSATKPVCPGKPALGKFLNAYANKALTPTNIKNAIKNIQLRKGFDGKSLQLQPRFLWVPLELEEEARDYCEVMQLLPSTVDSVSGGGNTSTVYGRLKVVPIPEMRDDLWIVAADPGEDHMKPLARVMGGPTGTYTANEDPENSGGGVPHVMVIPHMQDSEMFKTKLEMGVSQIINEGWSLATPHGLCANYTGSAS